MSTEDQLSQAAFFRDFFLAENRFQMEEICHPYLENNKLPKPTDNKWCELEFAFNRLFVGPRSVIAPPFASVYLEPESYVMGETTQSVRKLYHLVGVSSPWEGRIPDDHISLELDACLKFHHAIEETEYSPLIPVYNYFLKDHMSLWVPAFLQKIEQAVDVPSLIGRISCELSLWLQNECEWLTTTRVRIPESHILNEERRI
ncbi:MAG: hypothetical protein HN580_16595 [Deltaproteobacteria bacterium]|nr:hypothetical protein [Deltaproteobacteria bacterium]